MAGSMRVLVAVLGLLVGLFTLLAASVAFRLVPLEQITATLVAVQAFFATSDANLLIGVVAVAVLLTLSGLGIGALLPRKPRGFRYQIDEGEVIVPQRLVEELVGDALRHFPGMVRAEVKADQGARGARLAIELLTCDGSSLNASVEDLKEEVRRCVENQTGIEVGEIRMKIRLAESRTSTPSRERPAVRGPRSAPVVPAAAAPESALERPDSEAVESGGRDGQLPDETGEPARGDGSGERIVRSLRADPGRRFTGVR
jgi:hypothetical protein